MRPNNKRKTKSTKRDQAPQSKKIDLKSCDVQQMYDMAEQYYQQLEKETNNQWTTLIASAGTKRDKLKAATQGILESPQISLQYFQLFTRWCFDATEHFALEACETLSQLYLNNVFVEKKSLKGFWDQVQSKKMKGKKQVLVTQEDMVGFYMEHQIKYCYSQLIKALEKQLQSDIFFIRKKAAAIILQLSQFEELRRLLLSLVVNKFGDRQMINEVAKSLKKQFYSDIETAEILIEEVKGFLFREHLPEKSQFYVLNFLNGLNFRYMGERSITKTFELFYHFFQSAISMSQEQLNSRLFLNAVKGLNRIFSLVKQSYSQLKENIESKLNDIYRTFHSSSNGKAKIQLMLFLFQCHSYLETQIPDRYYRLFYQFLDEDFTKYTSLAEVFFDLCLTVLRQDNRLNRTMAFLKRILQVCFTTPAKFVVTCLMMLGKVLDENSSLAIMLKQRQNSLKDEREAKYEAAKRDPTYSGAQSTCLWELQTLCQHHHPTVRKMAQQLVQGKQITYQGDNPLLDLGVTSFVQKMCLRKDSKPENWRIRVKSKLTKIRRSKFESLLTQQSFKDDEKFIEQYLRKRGTIHPKTEKGAEDIEDFADNVVEKEMLALNPDLDEDFADMSSFEGSHENEQDYSEDEQPDDMELEGEQFEDNFEEDGEAEDEGSDSSPDMFENLSSSEDPSKYAKKRVTKKANQPKAKAKPISKGKKKDIKRK